MMVLRTYVGVAFDQFARERFPGATECLACAWDPCMRVWILVLSTQEE